MDQELKKKVALFRYSLIAPLITETYTQNTVREYLQEVCAKPHDTPQGMKKEYSPDTLKDWLRLYRRYGIDRLYPKSRSDKGVSRKLSKQAREFIIQSKIKYPRRPAQTIYQELIARGYAKAQEISLSTIQRFILNTDLSSKQGQ